MTNEYGKPYEIKYENHLFTKEFFRSFCEATNEKPTKEFSDMTNAELVSAYTWTEDRPLSLCKEIVTRAELLDWWDEEDSDFVESQAIFVLATEDLEPAYDFSELVEEDYEDVGTAFEEVLRENEGVSYYPMSEFNEMNGDPWEACRDMYAGEGNPNDDYFWYDGYYHIHTGDRSDFINEHYSDCYDEDIVEYLCNHRGMGCAFDDFSAADMKYIMSIYNWQDEQEITCKISSLGDDCMELLKQEYENRKENK